MGVNTMRPWDNGEQQAREINQMPPPGKGSPLTDDHVRCAVRNIAAAATTVLPDPTSPWIKRLIGCCVPMSPRMSAMTRCCASVSG